MYRLTALFLLYAVAARAADTLPPLQVNAGERLVVVAPHPDDETLATAGLIQHVLANGGSVWVVLVTAGDGYVEAVVHETGELRPRPVAYLAYGTRRIKEARAAIRELGENRVRVQLLGFPDGGLTTLLHAHWRHSHPERSQTTGVSDPPYPEALDPNIAYDGADLLNELQRLLREAQPTIVALPDPLDAHPDHHATAIFALLALDDAVRARALPLPRMLAYLVHWPAWPPGWDVPMPAAATTDAALAFPSTLPTRGLERSMVVLTDRERTRKRTALECYRTQLRETGPLLAAFVRRTEPFSIFTTAELQQAEQLMMARRAMRTPRSSGSDARPTPP